MKDKLTFMINVLGLAVALAAAVLVIVYVRFETSYDQFQPNAEFTYRMAVVALDVRADPITAYASIRDLRAVSLQPEVEDAFALVPWAPGENSETGEQVRVGERLLRLQNHYATTANIRDFVRLNVVAGDITRATQLPAHIALSRSEALRLFGTADIVGQQLVRVQGTWTVAAVFDDLPANTHYDFQSLSSASGLPETFRGHAYVRLRPNTNVSPFAQRMSSLLSGRSFFPVAVSFKAIEDLHLSRSDTRTALYIAMALSLVLIVIALLNCVNLSTLKQAAADGKSASARRSVRHGNNW